MKILLKNCNINNQIQNLLIDGEFIHYIGKNVPDSDNEIDIKKLHVIPGLIDPHVHVRDLRQSEKEDWISASKAALRGGITMVFDMPNTRPPTVNLEFLNLKREKAKHSAINYKFNVAATSQNIDDVIRILKTAPSDVAALKLFIAGSNSNEYVEDRTTIEKIFEISNVYNLPVIIHSELQSCIKQYEGYISNPKISDHNFIRNRECAIKSTEMLIESAKKIGNKIYIAHTSTAEEIEIIKSNKNKCRLYCETSPHHLLLNEDVLETAGNFGKVNPPLRTESDNKRILEAINEGTVDTIGTDHAPHLLTEKLKPYIEAPSGFPGLETLLPLLLNQVNNGAFSLEKLVELSSFNSSQIFNLPLRGKIKEGYYADLTVVDMNKQWKIEAQKFYSKAKYSPYENMTGFGDVEMTFVNGKLKYHNNNFFN
jgi:dihydroorotase